MGHLRKDFEIFGKAVTVKIVDRAGEAYVGRHESQTVYMTGLRNAVGIFLGKVCAVIERGSEQILIAVPADMYGWDICYECNLLHIFGGLMEPADKLYMKFEKTCGAVMFTEKDDMRKYLLIKNESGHIGFPKGHIEYGETELETAKREVFEETGLNFMQFGDFREEYTYTTRENSIKTGVFFIGHYKYRKPDIQQEEILDNWLLPYEEAMKLLNFPEDRALLEKADKYINSL